VWYSPACSWTIPIGSGPTTTGVRLGEGCLKGLPTTSSIVGDADGETRIAQCHGEHFDHGLTIVDEQDPRNNWCGILSMTELEQLSARCFNG
jgi:hypothetical protein